MDTQMNDVKTISHHKFVGRIRVYMWGENSFEMMGNINSDPVIWSNQVVCSDQAIVWIDALRLNF